MLSSIWTSPSAPRTPVKLRMPLRLERLEDRLAPSVTTVYVESNSPDPGENAVLAFRRDPTDGSLTQIGTFATGGIGQLNIPKVVGPDDSDQEVVATADGRFLFAVNQGSNSVTSFGIGLNGDLERIDTFDSGGVQPVSLGISGKRLYVANRGDATGTQAGTVAPNYTGFFINSDGSLTPIADSTVIFPVDTSPAQALISRTGRFLFANIFGISGRTLPQSNTIAPFLIKPDGTLQHTPGDDVRSAANPPTLLGTASHPTLNIVYAGFTGANQIGVFTYDETGRTSFVDSVPDAGHAACWLVVSADGNFLYVANTGTDSIGIFSLADPLQPVQIQELALSHVPSDQSQSVDFQIALDPSGQSLYVVNQSTDPTGTNPLGNQLHILSVAGDGTLSEPIGPIVFSADAVPANAHPQGVAAVSTAGNPGPKARASGFGEALLMVAKARELALASNAPRVGVQLALDSTSRVPLVLQTAATTQDIVTVPEATRSGNGQRRDSFNLDASGLDALFGSAF